MKAVKIVLGVAVLALGLVNAAFAQVSSINSAVLFPREFNDCPTSMLTTTNSYPGMISFNDQGVTGGGFANRHVWRFSNNGTTALTFNNDDFFEVFMTVTLTGPEVPRREAGFLLDSIGGQGQFIVTTNPREVAAFSGPFPFYAFPASVFTPGMPIRLGMTYFRDPADGLRKMIYHAGDMDSPSKTFTNLEQGIIDGSTLGGYLQVQCSQDPTNFAMAVYSNITITSLSNASTVSGIITLQSCVNSVQPITFEFRPTDGTAPFTRITTLDSSGNFTLPALPRKSYNVRIKGAKWLAKVVPVNTTAGDVTGVTATLLAGDANNDNAITTADYLLLKASFGATPTDPNWNNGAADFNCDGVVSTADYLLLKANFGLSGDL